MARRATRISQERARGEFVLVLDAGDSLANDQNPARKTQGQTSVAVMNLMGYDAIALGPKDLALGLAVLSQRIGEAQFAVLSANAVVSATGKLVAMPYVIRDLGGHQVALVGLSEGGGTKEIAVRDPLKTAQAVVAELMRRADVIILLSHAGAAMDRQIADAVPGIDLIVSGGSPALAAAWVSSKTNTPIVRADQASPGHAGRVMGVARLLFDSQGQLVKQNWQRVALGPEVADDPAMAAWLKQPSSR